jgi:hypothetical protein
VQLLDGGVAVRRFVHLVAGLGQAARQPAAQRVVIVSDENSAHNVLLEFGYLVIWLSGDWFVGVAK